MAVRFLLFAWTWISLHLLLEIIINALVYSLIWSIYKYLRLFRTIYK